MKNKVGGDWGGQSPTEEVGVVAPPLNGFGDHPRAVGGHVTTLVTFSHPIFALGVAIATPNRFYGWLTTHFILGLFIYF